MRTTGGYGSGQLSVNTLTLGIAGGTVEGHGTIPVDDTRRPGRIEARWAAIDAGQTPGIDRLAGTLSKSGTATVEWRREGPSAAPQFDVRATTGVVASGRTTGIDVRIRPSQLARRGVPGHRRAGPQGRRRHPSGLDIGSVGDRRTRRDAPIDLPAAIRQAEAFGAPLTSIQRPPPA
jgi:hypothetical protein